MPRLLETLPGLDGFRMPGEFEPHAGCWMLWPVRTDNWRMGAKPAQKVVVELAAAISQFEPVTVGVDRAQFVNARAQLPSQVRVVEISSNDSWMRDVGPTFVTNGKEVRAIDWRFNAWGGIGAGLYFPWDQDDLIASKVAELAGVERYRAPFVLEGGAIHSDGEGTILTTAECLLNPNRNSVVSRSEVESRLRDWLGAKKVIWLERGVCEDETDGHVDNLCCFLRPGVVALTWTEDRADPQWEVSNEALDVLRKEHDAQGRLLEVHRIQQPGPLFMTAEESDGVDMAHDSQPRHAGSRLAGSYVNFYLANGGAVVPTYGVGQDQAALEILQHLMPDRRVVGVPSRELLLGGGSIHCFTQQQPEV